ncbi:MAG TPA: AMP-binding protein, partial [Rugosimonospora sp.]|nr:AMP-binding protein [Rugosimonospora sp.]
MREQPQPAGPAGQHLVELFQRAAREYADRPAVADDARTISYAQLDARSTVLARALVRRGVRRGDRVAVYRQRGVDVFVALLGILKAGAAYVAIDVRYPDARRDLMLHGSGATLVVTEPGWRDRFDGLAVEPVEWHSEDVTEPVAGSGIPLCPTDMACVLFTSGSSGVPKAITLEHRNLVHLARNSMLAPLSPTDRFGQVASLSFDTFHIEAWCSLTSGAAVVVLPTMPELVAGDVQRQLRRRRVTALVAPTMAVNHVVHEDREAFSSLRVLYTGGDVLEPAAARTLLSGGFRGEFYNLYGPTEATTCCTTHHVAEVPEGCDNIPIGRELDGATVYVLDPDLNPVGDGEL